MKTKHLLSLLVILFLTIGACKKSSSPPATPAPATVTGGTWNWTACYESQNINVQGTSYPISGTNTLTFISGGTYSTVTTDYTQVGTPASLRNDAGVFSQPDSLYITSNSSGHYFHAKILKLDANNLWMRYRVYWGDYYELHFTR